ncbi:MAG TPA: hypothetical protein VK879_07775 [Candidatus Sulfomarinibacteraceae bacterium]|nr:hypothetical protein [Candidatus Sulfomarinibacteraceae bacterium]
MAEEKEMQVEEVDIEAIMQQIREQILARKEASAAGGALPLKISGKRFPPEFYEHIYQAGLAYDQVQVNMYVSKSSIPVLGPAVEWLRGKLHELVLYYVNQLAAKQITYNTHLLRAVSILAEELESLPAPDQTEEG